MLKLMPFTKCSELNTVNFEKWFANQFKKRIIVGNKIITLSRLSPIPLD